MVTVVTVAGTPCRTSQHPHNQTCQTVKKGREPENEK
jgi:hypothetical protein